MLVDGSRRRGWRFLDGVGHVVQVEKFDARRHHGWRGLLLILVNSRWFRRLWWGFWRGACLFGSKSPSKTRAPFVETVDASSYGRAIRRSLVLSLRSRSRLRRARLRFRSSVIETVDASGDGETIVCVVGGSVRAARRRYFRRRRRGSRSDGSCRRSIVEAGNAGDDRRGGLVGRLLSVLAARTARLWWFRRRRRYFRLWWWYNGVLEAIIVGVVDGYVGGARRH